MTKIVKITKFHKNKLLVKTMDFSELDNFELIFTERGSKYKNTILKYLNNADEFIVLILYYQRKKLICDFTNQIS